MVLLDDCLLAMRKLDNDSVDMVYLDPPFFTQKKQVMCDKTGTKYEFDDVWDSLEDYIEYFTERLVEVRRVLKRTGSVFLHCDTTASHHLRVAMDRIFGKNNFRNEIIWTYKRWSNSKRGLLDAHQTILFYSKTGDYKFNRLLTDYSPTTNIDQLLQRRARNESGKVVYKTDQAGKFIGSNEKRGVPFSDVWDIPFLNPKAKERVGYPTQKPISLLERIIGISTDEGDTVLDPFCGSGTTLVAASLMKRHYIGIDNSPMAIALTEKRLRQPVKSHSRLMRLGKEAYQTKTDYELLILQGLDCTIVQRNRGIDAFLKNYYNNAPVAIRIQKEGETLAEAAELLSQAAKRKDCSFTILIRISPKEEPLELPEHMLVLESYQLSLERYLRYLFGEEQAARMVDSPP